MFPVQLLTSQVHDAAAPPRPQSDGTVPSLAANVASVGGKHGAAIVAQASSALSAMRASRIPAAASVSAVAISITSLGLQVPQQMSVLFSSISFPIGFREVFSNLFSIVSVRFDLPEVAIPPYAPLIVVAAGVVVVGTAMIAAVQRDRVVFVESLRRWDERVIAYHILLRHIVKRALEGEQANDEAVQNISQALGSSFPPRFDSSSGSQDNLTKSLSDCISDASARTRVHNSLILQFSTLLDTFPQDTIALLCLCTIPQLQSEKISVADLLIASEKLQMLWRSFDAAFCSEASITEEVFHTLLDQWAKADDSEEFADVVAASLQEKWSDKAHVALTEEKVRAHIDCFIAAIMSWMVDVTAGNKRAFVIPFLELWQELNRMDNTAEAACVKINSSLPDANKLVMNSREAARFHCVLRRQKHVSHDIVPPYDRTVAARAFHWHSGTTSIDSVNSLTEQEVRLRVAQSQSIPSGHHVVPTTASYCCPQHERFLIPATSNHIKAVTLDGRRMYRCCNADSDELKQALHKMHTKGDACDDGEVFVCPDPRCAFTLCGVCLSREVGWFDSRVRIPIAGVLYAASHMSPPLVAVMSVIVLEALLFPVTQIPLLVLTCSPQISCWLRDCYSSWSGEFIASFVLSVFLLSCRLVIAVGIYAELHARQRAIQALIGSEEREPWAYFLGSCDRSLLRSLYIGTQLKVMSLEPIVRLVMDVGIVLAASLPVPDSIVQKCAVGLLYACNGIFLSLVNPNVLPSLNELAKMVSVHQLAVIGMSAIYDSVSIGAVENSRASNVVIAVMVLVTAGFLVFVAAVAWSTIVIPFVSASKSRAMEALIRRESQVHSLPDDPTSMDKKLEVMIQTYQRKLELSASFLPWCNNSATPYGTSQIVVSAAIILRLLQKVAVCDRARLLTSLEKAELSEGHLVDTVSQWLQQISGNEYLHDDEDSPFSLTARQLLPHESAALGAFIVSHVTGELRAQLMRVGPPEMPQSFLHCNQLQLLTSGAITQHLDFQSTQLRTCRLVRGTVIRNSKFAAANMTTTDMPGCSLIACDIRDAQVSPLSFVMRTPMLRFVGHMDSVNCVAFSPDGTLAATGSDDKTVRLWNASSGSEVAALRGHLDGLRFLVFSPDGRCLASCSRDKSVRVWDLVSYASLFVLDGHTDAVRALCYSPDGAHLFSGGRDKTIRVWNTIDGGLASMLNGHTNVVTSIALTPDGLFAVSGSDDCTARLWDVKLGSEVRVFNGHSDAVNSVGVSRDGQRVLTASRDKSLRLWDISSGSVTKVLMGHSGVINCAAFSFDGLRIVSGSDDKSIRVWDTASGDEIAVVKNNDVVRSVAFSYDGVRLVAALYQTVVLCDVGTALAERIQTGHVGEVNSVSFSRDGAHCASTGADKTVRVWNSTDGLQIARFSARSKSVGCVSFSPDGTRLAFVDNAIRVLDTKDGRDLLTIAGHQSAVTCVAFAEHAQCIASGSFDKTARTWSTSNAKQIAVFEGHMSAVTTVAISGDGSRLVSGSDDKTVRIWDCATSLQMFCLSGHADAVKCVELSSDSSLAVSGSRDRTLRIWNIVDGSVVRVVQGHASAITSIALSPDGAAVVSGSVDKTVRLWNTVTGDEITAFNGHSRSVRGVAWSRDGNRILSCSDDGTIRMWPVPGSCLQSKSFTLGECRSFTSCSELLVLGDALPLQSILL